jgi:hypothetical protein
MGRVLNWMIGFIGTLHIHTTRDYRQYSAIAILHTVAQALGFSVFTSRILATDLPQSHCHFRSHMKSSFHSLIHFLPLFCICQLNSIPVLPGSSRQAGVSKLDSTRLDYCCSLPLRPKVEVQSCYDRRIRRPVRPGMKHPSGA